jgi:hypothetical protein
MNRIIIFLSFTGFSFGVFPRALPINMYGQMCVLFMIPLCIFCDYIQCISIHKFSDLEHFILRANNLCKVNLLEVEIVSGLVKIN